MRFLPLNQINVGIKCLLPNGFDELNLWFVFFFLKMHATISTQKTELLSLTNAHHIHWNHLYASRFGGLVALWSYSSFFLLGYLARIMLLLFFLLLVFANMMLVLMAFDFLLMHFLCFWILTSLLLCHLYFIIFYFFSIRIIQYSNFPPKHPALDFVWFMCWVLNCSLFPFAFLIDFFEFSFFKHDMMFMIMLLSFGLVW